MAKFQFCNFVQIFVAAREIHSYACAQSKIVRKNIYALCAHVFMQIILLVHYYVMP